ncbi:hypothetical protein ACFL6P_09255, partial [Candidatus Latescibacterota bacterium]
NENEALQIGKVLQANLIIVGSFLYENNTYRITCRALDVETSVIRFADQSENTDIFRAIDDLSTKILSHMGFDVREKPQSLFYRVGPWGTMLLTAGAAGGSFLMHNQGNDAYDNYLQAITQKDIDSYYNDAASFDSKRNTLIGISAGAAILTVYLYKTQKSKEWEIRKVEFIPWMSTTYNGTIIVGLAWKLNGGRR